MPREKKYTRTVAIRVTDEEYALIQRVIDTGAPIGGQFRVPKKPTDVIRTWIAPHIDSQRRMIADEAKRAEARAKRAATKAAKAAQA